MRNTTRKDMAQFIRDHLADVDEDIRSNPAYDARLLTDAHKLSLPDIAAGEGHTDLAQQLRREIGD